MCTASESSYMFELDKGDDFEPKVLQSSIPMLIQFSANWCGPCKQAKPIIKSAVSEFKGKAGWVIVDVDKHGDIAEEFQVNAIPAVFGVHNKHIKKLKGSPHNPKDITAFINEMLAEKSEAK